MEWQLRQPPLPSKMALPAAASPVMRPGPLWPARTRIPASAAATPLRINRTDGIRRAEPEPRLTPAAPRDPLSIQAKGDQYIADRQRNVLPSVRQKADGRSINPIIAGEIPQALARAGIEGKDDSFQSSAEHQVAGSGHDTAPGRRDYFVLPFNDAAHGLDRRHLPPTLFRSEPRRPPHEESHSRAIALAAFRCRSWMPDSVFREHTALLAGEDIEQLRQRAVTMRHPVRTAVHPGPYLVISFRRRFIAGDHLWTAIVIKTLGPGLLYEIFGQQELAVGAVQQIKKAVPVSPRQQLSLLAPKLAVEQDRDLSGIPVMQIMRRKLEIPF